MCDVPRRLASEPGSVEVTGRGLCGSDRGAAQSGLALVRSKPEGHWRRKTHPNRL